MLQMQIVKTFGWVVTVHMHKLVCIDSLGKLYCTAIITITHYIGNATTQNSFVQTPKFQVNSSTQRDFHNVKWFAFLSTL